MSGFYRPAIQRVARIRHDCEACFGPIAVGEAYEEQTGIWEGKAFRNRFHFECFEALCEEGEGEFSPGSYDPPERLKATSHGGSDA